MVRLRVREIAEAMGLNKNQLQLRSGLGMPTVRRYWYQTKDGSETGEPLQEINLFALTRIAKVLGVKATELFEETSEGNSRPMLVAA